MSQGLKELYQKLEKLGQEEKWDEVITVSIEILGLEKDDEQKAVIYAIRGIAYSNKGDYSQAIPDFDRAIKLKQDYAAAYNNRGNAYNKKGDYGRAILDYNRAIDLKLDYADAYYNRGIAYDKKGDYDRAILDYNRAIDLKLDYADAYYNRGITYIQKEKYEYALKDFIKASDDQKLKLTYPFVYIASRLNEIIPDENNTDRDNLFRYYSKLLSVIQSIQLVLFYKRKNENDGVAHYTSLDALRSLADEQHFRLYNASYMNDPKEGRVLFKIMKDKIDIEKEFYSNDSVKDRLSPAYIGSFIDISSREEGEAEDELFLWRTYGKHNNKEAAGACLIFNAGQFAREIPSTIGAMEQMQYGQSDDKGNPVQTVSSDSIQKPTLYLVKYQSGEAKDILSPLAEPLKQIAELRNKSLEKRENLDKLVRELLDSIRFLFKAEHYKEEKEARVVQISYHSDPRQKPDMEQLPPRFYIEQDNFRFSEVILGPQAGGLRRWKWWLQSKNENLKVEKSAIEFGEDYQ